MAVAAIPAAIAVAQMVAAHNNQPGQAAAPGGISGLGPSIQTAQQGVQTNIGNQNAFAQALQTQMNGGGPNLAGSLLANATGKNVANQAALMAGQRGVGSNAGLIAREAAQQGGALQQNAAGQAAAIRQQQQLNAQQGLGNVYGQIGQEQGQNLSSNLQAATGQQQQIVGTNQINAQTGQANAAAQSGQLAGLGQAAVGLANTFSSSKPTAPIGASAGPDTSIANGGPMFAAEGGEIPKNFSQELHPHLQALADIYHPHMSNVGYNAASNSYAKGGMVNALVSPGEILLSEKNAKKVADGKADPTKVGEKVPGKPKVSGAINSYANDTVPKKLKEGIVVVPRSESQSDSPARKSAEFVQAVVEKQGKKKVKK